MPWWLAVTLAVLIAALAATVWLQAVMHVH